MNQVIKVSAQEMKKLKENYHPFFLNKSVPYTEFVAKKNGTTITAYTSGKVMFQGANAEQEAARWTSSTVPTTKNTKTKKNVTTLPKNFAQLSVIGSDEVGNGSYFGPLCVCAAYVDRAHLALLKELGVRDSKELKDSQIISIAKNIREVIPYQLLVVPPKKYNAIQPTYNAVRMKVALHNQAIQLLLKQIAPKKPEGILIDQFTPEVNYKKYVRLEKEPVQEKIFFITKGEHYHLAVAAASIISRASFLEELDKASNELGIPVPSGAGAKSDHVAAKILQRGGIDLLNQYAKLHFANTEKAKRIAGL
ncbi:MAG: ribonuclease HIII [Enterococcus sp.]